VTPSPPPQSRKLPSFLSASGAAQSTNENDEERRTRFRRVYMETLVKGFGSDLEKIRTVSLPTGLCQSGREEPILTNLE
jgi:hypothetical protein